MLTLEEWKQEIYAIFKSTMEMTNNGKDELEFAIATLFASQDPATGETFDRPQTLVYLGRFIGDSDEEVYRNKLLFRTAIRATAVAANAEGAIFITEAWTTTQPTDSVLVQPSKCKDRKSAIIVISDHREHGKMLSVTEIKTVNKKRYWDGCLGEAVPVLKGFFSELIYPSVPTDDQIAEAREVYRNHIQHAENPTA